MLYLIRCSLKRSLRRVRSNARLYQTLADQETDEASCKRYRLLAVNARRRVMRSLCAEVPMDGNPLGARAWRRLLVLSGPRIAEAWIEWRESRELTLIIAVARVVTWLTTLGARRVTPTP